MLTGMYAVRNMFFREGHDLWAVNTEQEYHEEVREEDKEPVSEDDPQVMVEAAWRPSSRRSTARLWPFRRASSADCCCSRYALLLIRGGPHLGQTLQLLNNYLPGFRVTWGGSFIGLAYGVGLGFLGGWLFAFIRNSVLFLYMALVQRRAERQVLRKLLEFI